MREQHYDQECLAELTTTGEAEQNDGQEGHTHAFLTPFTITRDILLLFHRFLEVSTN
jgi:hypothetical protein